MNEERHLTRLADIEQKPLDWLWPGWLPLGTIVDFSGDPGQAKSGIAYDLAARITTGQPMPNCTNAAPPAGVVLIQGEDLVDTMVKPTLLAAGADVARIFVYDPKGFAGQPLTLPDDLQLVADAVAEVHAKLVVIDPATVFFACNPNSEPSVRRALQPITDFAQQAGVTVLLVRHLNKNDGGNLLYQAGGSIAWIAAARSAPRAISDPASSDPHRHLLVQIKTNLPSEPTLAYRTVLQNGCIGVQWLGNSSFTAKEMNIGQLEERTRRREAMDILFLILRNGPLHVEEVIRKAKQQGVAKRTLERAKVTLGVRSQRHDYGFHWHWEWQLPEDENAVLHALRQKYEALDAESQEAVAPTAN